MVSLALALLLASSARAADPEPPAPAPPPEEAPITQAPQVLEYVEAPYPPDAKAQGVEGTVLLVVTLDEAGAVTDVQVEKPAGYGFDEAAVVAVKQMRFSPAMTAEGPVAVSFEFEYGFVLEPETPPEAVPAPVNLEGNIHEMGTRKPVGGARVAVDGTDLVATTDEQGHFEIRGAPVGADHVRVLEPGHVTLEQTVDVVEGQVTTANLWIRALEYRENEAVGVYHADDPEITRRTITIDEVRKIPGTFGDPVRIVQTLPGAARSPFGTGLLVIRGSNPEDSAVYVDGIRIPIIYHLTGTTSVLAPDLIAGVDYLPGNYGVEYGRSMGGVVDITTRERFDDKRIVWKTDILDTGVYVEGNAGKNKKQGFAIAARRSYIDALLPLFLSGGYVIKPRYWDYQVKWAPVGTQDDHGSLFVYGFNDLLSFSSPDSVAQGTDQDTQGDLSTTYSSHRIVGRYEHRLSEGVSWRVLPSLGVDYEKFGLGNDFTLDSTTWLAELRTELSMKPGAAVEFVPGVDFIGGFWQFVFAAPFHFTDLSDPLDEREPVTLDGHGTAWAPDFYLSTNLRPLAKRDRMVLSPGVRLSTDYITFGGSTSDNGDVAPYFAYAVDPRFLGKVALTNSTTVKGGTGLYNQPPQPFQSIGVGTEVTVDFERSWSSDLGFEQKFGQAISLDVDGFYKRMDRLIVFDPAWQGYGTEPFINAGFGRAYGIEIILRHAKVDRFFGWISYTLSKSERKDPDHGQDWYPFAFDQPHIFSAQGGYDLPWDFDVSAQVQYVSGNPDTPYDSGVYDVDGDYYNPFRVGTGYQRLPPYFQTSVRLDRLWTFKAWQLSTYVDLMNVVRSVNPEFTIYSFDYTDHAYVRGLPFIPNIGFEARFWP